MEEITDEKNENNEAYKKTDAPVTITTDDNSNGVIDDGEKKLYLIQTNAFQSFYMVPKGTNVNTNNISGEYMLWYFLDAGIDNGTQYYYIVSNSENKYICHAGGTDGNKRTVTLVEKDASNEERCKFKLVENETGPGFYNINAKGNPTYYGLNKQNGSQAATNPIRLTNNQYINDANSKWKFISYSGSFTWPSPPFTVSTSAVSDTHYYKIHNVQNSSYYVSTDATPDKVTYASTETNNMVWFFKEAGSDSWFKYYYIVNPEANKYMYYSGTAIDGSDQTNAVCVKTYDSGNEDRYQFVVVQAARGDGDSRVECYAIIPKPLTGNLWTSSSIGPKGTIRDGLNMGIITSRGANNTAQWQFITSDYPLQCAAPTISYSSATGKITLASTTPGATIYYTTDGTTTPSSSTGIEYSSAFDVSAAITIKAIAVKTGYWDSEVTTKSYSQVATPSIQNNGSNAISITCATTGATIYYTTNGSMPTTSSTVYSSPLTENVSGVTIKAIAVKEDMINSAVATGSVTLQCAKPIIARIGDNATINCSFPSSGVSIYYTKNGGTPSSSSTPYSNNISVTTGDVIRAIAIASDYTNSEVSVKTIHDELTPTGGVYYINNDADFESFVEMANEDDGSSYHYKLTANVNASTAIAHPFTGIFDGAGYTITGLTHPLFNAVEGGVVKNVMLDDVTISSGTNVGAVCGEATGDSRIYNCGVLATGSTVTTDEDGYTKITSCSSTISGSGYVGGLVGLLDGSSRVINCFSYANVSGDSHVGGIVGYNNVATTASDLQTMVMNCMFYGEVSGSSIAPIYNGEIITNDGDADGVNNFNYFRLESAYIQNTAITKVYNCALGAETRFLQRFEFFRHLLNSNRELAAWWASTSSTAVTKGEIMKWVLEPTQIGTTTPYPILKTPGKYASVVNYDAASAQESQPRNKGGKLGTLEVTIQMGGGGAVYGPPTGAAITNSDTTLIITDKDTAHYNFNYYKVQLPYYNDVGTKNYNGNRVVTGWKIVNITGGTPGTFTASDTWGGYNFADRHCTNKDLFSVSSRIFNQGAYWDVPEGVTAITIEPYWAKCVYLADPNADKVYNQAMETGYDVPNVGGGQKYTNGNSYSIAGDNQVVFTTMGNAIASSGTGNALFQGVTGSPGSQTVYDYAVVLVGNYHHFYAKNTMEASKSKPYTVTSIDLDGDNEPDYSYILRFNDRTETHPVRADFINIPGLGMAQKSTGGTGSYNFGIMIPKGWFESTNTSLLRFTQFEYEHSSRSTTDALIVQGGVMEQWVSSNQKGTSKNIPYIHVGGNVWFKEFHTGCHQDKDISTLHSPISVTGGDYDEFYLTGLYVSCANSHGDNAECYINGGRFGTVCGAAMEGIGKANGADNTGNITWQIQNADIKEFYAGALNAARPATGNLSTTITNSHVDVFCGGPKFGDMSSGKTVTTTATGCTFGTFFGAGYGGNSYSRQAPKNHNSITNFPHNDGQAGNDASWNAWLGRFYKREYNATYGGVSTQFNYQFLPMSGNANNVARIFVEYVKFSLATTRNVTSTLTNCTITGNFYGGGSLGKVEGNVTSILDSCTVQGSVFGAGYSASRPTVAVDSLGFRMEPYYYEDLGTYRNGVKGVTTPYTWEHRNTVDKTSNAIDKTNHILYTTEDLSETNLGSVEGNAILTLQGTTRVEGNVYGGGDQSVVKGANKGNTTVILKGSANVLGNVYGGGNKGAVSGSSRVLIQDQEIQNN